MKMALERNLWRLFLCHGDFLNLRKNRLNSIIILNKLQKGRGVENGKRENSGGGR